MTMMTLNSIEIVDHAITSRRSVRAFLPKPVPRETITDILQVASRSPSGSNTQPWQVHVLTGDTLNSLKAKIMSAHNDPELAKQHTQEYEYYPTQWVSPFIDRRRKNGWDLYGLLGLTKDNKAGMHAQHGRNYVFFDAPVGLIFSIKRVLEQGSWMDYGMFLQSIMVAARARGLDTCPQAAFTPFHRIISEHLKFAEDEMLVCGMALGWADEAAHVNTFTTVREPVEGFTRFYE
jgi:nitroreductase